MAMPVTMRLAVTMVAMLYEPCRGFHASAPKTPPQSTVAMNSQPFVNNETRISALMRRDISAPARKTECIMCSRLCRRLLPERSINRLGGGAAVVAMAHPSVLPSGVPPLVWRLPVGCMVVGQAPPPGPPPCRYFNQPTTHLLG